MPLARAVRTKSSPSDSIIDARAYRVYDAAFVSPSVSQAAIRPLAQLSGLDSSETYAEGGRKVAYSATMSATTKYGTELSVSELPTRVRSGSVPRFRAAIVPVSTPTVRKTTAPPS